jgi:hypothetical protein
MDANPLGYAGDTATSLLVVAVIGKGRSVNPWKEPRSPAKDQTAFCDFVALLCGVIAPASLCDPLRL